MKKRYLLRVVAVVLTFALGTMVAFCANWVATVPFGSSVNGSGSIAIEEYVKTRFSESVTGCGIGVSGQSFETDDGRMVSEVVYTKKSPMSAKLEFGKEIKGAEQIVQRVKNYRDYRGQLGERVVLVNKADESGNNSVTILFYDGSRSYSFINAPTMDLALEFEQIRTEQVQNYRNAK